MTEAMYTVEDLIKYADSILPIPVLEDEESKFLLEIAEDESLTMKIIGDLTIYGVDIPEKLIDGLVRGYNEELIREYWEDCLYDSSTPNSPLFIFPARAGLQINGVSLLLAAQTISTRVLGAHTEQAKASFPDKSLLCSVLSGWYPPPGLK